MNNISDTSDYESIRKIAKDTQRNSDWLINFYTDNHSDADLYTCKIGDIEKQIAFLTKTDWHTNILIDLNNPRSDQLIDFNKSNSDFNIDWPIIELRKMTGTRMYPDGPAVYLDSFEKDQNNKLCFHIKECSYYQVFSNIAKIEDETFRSISDGTNKTSFRNEYIPNADVASELRVKPFGLGCATLMALKIKKWV